MFKSRKNKLLVLLSLIVNSTVTAAANDPMRPPSDVASTATKAVQVKTPTSYYLNSIRITKNQRYAIINGKRVTLGKKVGHATVTAINANNVTLQKAGKTIKISLLPLSIKTPVEATQP